MAAMLVGLLDDADGVPVAGGAGAVAAGIDVGDVVADGAEAELFAQDEDGVGEGAGVVVGAAQKVEGEALGGFGADAGELAQFVDEAGDGVGEAGHCLLQAWKVEAAHHAGDGRLDGLVGAAAGLVDGGGDEVFEEFDVAGGGAEGGGFDLEAENLLFPFMRTETMPPPDSASTMVAASFCSIWACISRACDIISFILARSGKGIGRLLVAGCWLLVVG